MKQCLLLLSLGAGLAFGPAALAAEAPKPKFNILHINADDHRADCLSAFGHPVVKTPNLDTLVERGLTFTHCYTMGSMSGGVCQPSRTMLQIGKGSAQSRGYGNDDRREPTTPGFPWVYS